MARAGASAQAESALPNAGRAVFWLFAVAVFPAYVVLARHVVVDTFFGSDALWLDVLWMLMLGAPAVLTILAGLLLARPAREVVVAAVASTGAFLVGEVAYGVYLFDFDDI